MSREKVVKLEEVSGGFVRFEDDNILGFNDPSTSYFVNTLSKSSKHSHDEVEDFGCERSDYIEDHVGDTFTDITDLEPPMSLPAGWPQIPQLFVRQSWDLSTCMTPAVNKVTSHLELLQTIIEEWCAATEADLRSRLSSAATLVAKSRATSTTSQYTTNQAPGTEQSSRLALRESRIDPYSSEAPQLSQHPTEPSSRLSKTSRVTLVPALKKSASATNSLSIKGIGAKPIEEVHSIRRYTPQTPEYDIPYLGAEEVIEEVITLLAHLENDRRDTKDLLREESKRVILLQERIDMMCHKRLLELPDAVQREHEACALDINELNWHVNYRSRVETRTQSKVDIALALNKRLEEDIAFVGKHVPLVEEKLELEKDAMDRIRQAQLDTNEELNTTVEKCAKVEAKSEQAHQKAAAEREQIKNDIQAVKNELQQVTDELTQARATHNSYIAMSSDYNHQLADNKQEGLVLHIREQNIIAAEKMTATKVKDVQAKIVDEEFEHGRLEDDNYRKKTCRDTNRKTHAKTEAQFHNTIESHTKSKRDLTLKNKELDMEIEDHEDKIKECDRQKASDEKNVARMAKEMIRTEEQLKVTLDDYSKVIVINNAVKNKYNKEKGKCHKEEEALKTTSDTLMKRVAEERHSRKVIQARMSTEDGDLQHEQSEARVMKQKISSKADKIDQAVKHVLSKVEKLREAYAERVRIKTELQTRLAALKQDIKDLEDNFKSTKAELKPKIDKLKSDLTNLEKKIDHMEWKTEMMTEKISGMDADMAVIKKVTRKTDREIQNLEEELEELNLKIDSGTNLQDSLKITINRFTARNRDADQRHRVHMEERRDVLADSKRELKKNLQDSKDLASDYRNLQNKYVKCKNELYNMMEEREKMEIAIKDLKQLQALQIHMHRSLEELHKLRGLYNKSEISNMNTQSNVDSNAVHRLQEEMDTALEDISVYLHQQMDPMVARRIAMDKVTADEERSSRMLPSSALMSTELDTSSVQTSKKPLPPIGRSTVSRLTIGSTTSTAVQPTADRQITVSVTAH